MYPRDFLTISFGFEVVEIVTYPSFVVPFEMAWLSGSPKFGL
jgi:hypothetical protein